MATKRRSSAVPPTSNPDDVGSLHPAGSSQKYRKNINHIVAKPPIMRTIKVAITKSRPETVCATLFFIVFTE